MGIRMARQVIDDKVDKGFKSDLLLFAVMSPKGHEHEAGWLPVANAEQILKAIPFEGIALHIEVEIPFIRRGQPLEAAAIAFRGRENIHDPLAGDSFLPLQPGLVP